MVFEASVFTMLLDDLFWQLWVLRPEQRSATRNRHSILRFFYKGFRFRLSLQKGDHISKNTVWTVSSLYFYWKKRLIVMLLLYAGICKTEPKYSDKVVLVWSGRFQRLTWSTIIYKHVPASVVNCGCRCVLITGMRAIKNTFITTHITKQMSWARFLM